MDEVTPILPSPKLPRDFMQVVIIPFTFHWWWWWWRWNERAGFRLVPLKFQFYRLQIDMSVPPHSEHDLVVCGGDRGQGGGHIRRPCDCTACHWYGSVVVAGLLSGRTICPTRGQSSTNTGSKSGWSFNHSKFRWTELGDVCGVGPRLFICKLFKTKIGG